MYGSGRLSCNETVNSLTVRVVCSYIEKETRGETGLSLSYSAALTVAMKSLTSFFIFSLSFRLSSIILTIFEPIITPSADRPGRSDTYLFAAWQGFTGEKVTGKPLSLGQIDLTFNARSGILVGLLYLDSDKLI